MKKMLGKRIKELRQQKLLSQGELAEKLGMGERNLSKIECGINFISADSLEAICDVLAVTPAELFDFSHLKEKNFLKEELLNAIKEELVDIELLYKIYKSLKP